MGKMLGGVVAAVLVGGLISSALGLGGDDDETDGPDAGADPTTSATSEDDAPSRRELIGDKIGAQVVCEDFVEDRLKAPSTAEFSGAAVRHVGGKRWTVVGDVDSENGFGAMLRSKYVCDVTFVGDDRYQLRNLDIR